MRIHHELAVPGGGHLDHVAGLAEHAGPAVGGGRTRHGRELLRDGGGIDGERAAVLRPRILGLHRGRWGDDDGRGGRIVVPAASREEEAGHDEQGCLRNSSMHDVSLEFVFIR
ncbi:hypothetical protein D3C81_1085330 [compost metagenome]